MTINAEVFESMPTVQQTLAADPGPRPPAPLTETAPRDLGIETVSAERYLSADWQRLEYQRMWSRVWQWACTLGDIPNVGDHTVYDIGDRSVLIVRVAEPSAGEPGIKAFHNACLHRGRQLKEGPGHSDKLMCGFHGWTWNLDGSLARIPCRWDFPQVVDVDAALPQVRCEVWSQFVFVNFDDDAGPLAEALDVIPEHFKHYPLDDKFAAINVSKVVGANWKIAQEAFLEGYHDITTHPQILEWVGDANSQYDIWRTSSRLVTLTGVGSPHLGDMDPGDVFASAMEFVTAGILDDAPVELPDGQTPRQAVADVVRREVLKMTGADVGDRSISEILDNVGYLVYPNFHPWGGATGNCLLFRFRPNGDDPYSSIMEFRVMLPVPDGGPRPPDAPVRVLGPDEPWTNAPELGVFSLVLEQDEANMVAVQRGLRAKRDLGRPFHQGMNYGRYQESRLRHFHTWLDSYCQVPAPTTVTALDPA